MKQSDQKRYVIKGPTSGIGRATAFELVKHGTLVLVARNREKLRALESAIQQEGALAVSVVCDLSDMESVRCAAAEIIALRLPIVGLVNNAGIFPMRPAKSAQNWDLTFATNHLGPFALTEALIPHLPDRETLCLSLPPWKTPSENPPKCWECMAAAMSLPKRVPVAS